MKYKLYIFDMDGTLTTTRSGAKFRKTSDDWQFLPGVLEKLRKLLDQGKLLAVATNQGGIAYGLLDYEAMCGQIRLMCEESGIAYWRICPYHPGGKIPEFSRQSHDRKPEPGMLTSIMLEAGAIAKEDTLMVGDRAEDAEAAALAGIAFCPAEKFFTEEEEILPLHDDQDLTSIDELLGVELKILEDGNRMYIGGGTYGKSKYHIVERRYDGGIQIEQIEIDKEWAKRVSLSEDQVPQLLKTLLVWYLEKWKEDHKPLPDLGHLNDHPF